MKPLRLSPDDLHVASFEPQPDPQAALSASEPDTWEDTCIKMCPTDDTCTKLGCTQAVL